jgi:predicted nuclease with TOPRIM domain
MDKDTAKAILIANFKGSKRKRSSLLTIAEAVRLLLKNGEYKTSKKLAEAFDVSRQIVESFDKMNDQPKEIQKLIAEGKVLIDANTKLASIPDIKKRIEIAKLVAGLTAFETRDIIDYWKKHPELSPEKCKEVVLKSKTHTQEIHLIVVPLETSQFDDFQKVAKSKGVKIDEAARLAIEEWISKHGMK